MLFIGWPLFVLVVNMDASRPVDKID